MNPRMSMMPQPHANMMHPMHPSNPPGQGPPGAGPQVSQPGQANSPMGHSPMNQTGQSPMGGGVGGPHSNSSPLHTNSPLMKNPAKNDDYSLDFLDSIPGESSENNGKSANPENDDLMKLLDS